MIHLLILVVDELFRLFVPNNIYVALVQTIFVFRYTDLLEAVFAKPRKYKEVHRPFAIHSETLWRWLSAVKSSPARSVCPALCSVFCVVSFCVPRASNMGSLCIAGYLSNNSAWSSRVDDWFLQLQATAALHYGCGHYAVFSRGSLVKLRQDFPWGYFSHLWS